MSESQIKNKSKKIKNSNEYKKQMNSNVNNFGSNSKNDSSNSINKKRISYIDITRGFALFGMIFLHIIDILSKKSVYLDYPYYIPWIEMTTAFPPSIIFMFVSGISVYILTNKRLKIKSKSQTFIEVLKRYGKYIIISVFFCYFMWDISIFLKYEEAFQGAATSAILTSLILILTKKFDKKPKIKYTIFTSIIIILSLLRHFVMYQAIRFSNPIASFFNHMFFRGWFSIGNILPLMLGGVIFYKIIKKYDKYKVFVATTSLLALSIIIHNFLGRGKSILKISYGMQSFHFTIFAILLSGLTLLMFKGLIEWFQKSKMLYFLKDFGFAAYENYVIHHILIVKIIELTPFMNNINDLLTVFLAIPITLLSYLLANKVYLLFFRDYKSKLFDPLILTIIILAIFKYFNYFGLFV